MPPVAPDLQAALDRGALVLAPTAYSAQNLRAAFDRQQRAAGLATWQPANVLSWQQWLGSLWTALILDGHESRLLLNPAQEELLWRDLILPTLAPANRTSAPAFAALARSAYGLATSYQITSRLARETTTEDTAQFAEWAADFSRLCARHACLPAAQLPSALAEHLQHQRLNLPSELHLANFPHPDDLSPADAALLQAIRQTRVRVIRHTPPPVPANSRVVLQAATEVEELRAAAHWLRTFLDDHLATNPEVSELPSVQVVLANPSPDLPALDSIFREILAPELDDVTTDSSSAPWELAGGRPLAGQPIIVTLVRVLRGLTNPLPVEDITALLLSPYLGRDHDRDAAGRLDVRLRDLPPLRPELTFRELHRQIQTAQPTHSAYTPSWLPHLMAFLRDSGDLTAPRTHAAWATFIRDLADVINWPGAQSLTPAELASTETWDHLLDSLSTLDFAGRRIPFAEALGSLEHHLRSATITLPTHALIQIVSAAEAATSPADVLLLLQATDTNWPPAARPHPLLPWPLQASAAMPGTNPARDAARAERLTEILLANPIICVSSAAQANDAPQRLAPSIAHFAAREQNPPWVHIEASKSIHSFAPLVTPEQVIDDTPLPPLPSPEVPGGARVLELQAACGFRAFAEIRLRATEPRTSGLGIDAGRSGSILHNALDIFWTRLESQANLLALTDEACEERVQAAVEQAFARAPGMLAAPNDTWDRAYRALQVERLYGLLKDWLRFERNRAPFTVLAREQARDITVGPLHLQLRVDRMDSVQDGAGTVLVDYKTGATASPTAWESDRPDEPQLPLYALLPHAAELQGLAFARIRAGGSRWAGIQSEPDLLGKVKLEPDLATRIEEWRDILTGLANQFAYGDHSVNPKSYPDTCTFCTQRLLCRLDPTQLLARSNEEEAVEIEEDIHG